MGMYDTLVGQGVAPANTYNVQSQLYSKLGGSGNYSGSAQQNIWLQGAMGGRNYQSILSPTPQSSPAAPPPAAPPAPSGPTTYADAANAITNDLNGTYKSLYAPVTSANSAVQSAQQKLIDYYSGLTKPVDRYQQLYNENGVQQAQDEVNKYAGLVGDTQNKLDSLRNDVMQSTSPFLMSMADRNLYYNEQRQPLDTALSQEQRGQEAASTALTGKQNLIKTLMDLYTTQDQEGAKPFELGVNSAESALQNAESQYGTLSKQAYDAANAKLSAQENDIKAAQDMQIEKAREAAAAAQAQVDEANKEKEMRLDYQLKSSADQSSPQMQAQQAQRMWDSLAADPSFNSTYDIWKYVTQNANQLKAAGIDPNLVLSQNNAYIGKYGQDAPVRPGAKPGARYTGKPF